MNKIILKELQVIPGVGKSIAVDLYQIGIRKVTDLKGKDPQRLYDDMCHKQGQKLDKCMLYVMRGAVYFASHKTHKPELLNWWAWKDKNASR